MKILARLRLHPLTILGAALFSLATPVFGLSFLAWICLVPFLIAIERQPSWRGALAQGLWLSVLTTAGVYYWLPPAVTEFHDMPGWVPWLFFPVYGLLAQPQLIGYALVRWAWRGRHDLVTVAASALLYTGLDWLSPKLFVDTMGQMFFDNLVLVQVIDLGGVYLLTLLLVLVNEAANAAVTQRMRPRGSRESLRVLAPRFIVAGVLVAATAGYGLVRGNTVRAAQEQPPASFRAALIQANVGNFAKVASEKGDLEAVTTVLTSYGRLSDQQATSQSPPDVLIWPETAYPLAYGAGRSSVDESMDAELRMYVKARNIPLLFGGYHVVEGREYNSALIVDPTGELGVYHKYILLPFGEYLPLVGDWDWVREKFPRVAQFGVGGTPRVIDIPLTSGVTVKAAPIICYEALFAEHAIAGASAGGQVIVNLTNDAWFGSVAEKRLHLAMSALRSVETRRPQLRATNTGISALILPDGEIVNPGPVDAEASLVYQVPLVDLPPTLIMRIGPWAGPASLAAGFLLALFLFLRRRHQRRARA
jgi:apolipoprotein N-acyltransferase